jgi:release factor glutamine methyltransferase
MTVREALMFAPRLPRLDREVLLSHAIGQDRVFLMAHGETELTAAQLNGYRAFIARAMKHEPIAYITGTREFYGRDFFVGPGVLIPRPETELIVDQVLKNISVCALSKKKCAVIDVGTGSGAIITSIFLSLKTEERKNLSWFAVDNEDAALRYARRNARHLDTNGAIRFLKSDLLSRLLKQLSSCDEIFVVANLPYLSSALYRRAAPNVRRYEPKSALHSGTDGLDHYQRLMTELCSINAAGVKVNFFLEISPEQAKMLSSLCADITALSSLEMVPDLAGKARLVIGTLAGKEQNKNPA